MRAELFILFKLYRYSSNGLRLEVFRVVAQVLGYERIDEKVTVVVVRM